MMTASPCAPISLFKKSIMSVMLASTLAAVGLSGCSKPDSAAGGDSAPSESQKKNETADAASNVANNDNVATAKIDVDTVKGVVSLPINPAPVVVYDMTLLQDLAALDVAVDGKPANLKLNNLQSKNQPDPKEVGTVFEPDLEALNALQPQAILIGSRMAEKYDELSAIAPTLDMSIDTANIYESSKKRLHDLGALFGKSDEALKLQQDIDNAISETKAVTKDKGRGLVVMVNGNKLSAYGPDSRFGFVHTILDIPAADGSIHSGSHGQPISFEYIKKTNPDWLFVLDRSAAIGEDGKGAKAVLDNPLVAQTPAWKNQQVVYLSPDSYLAFGGYHQWMQDLTTIKKAFSGVKSPNAS